jgi:hypothetical protein
MNTDPQTLRAPLSFLLSGACELPEAAEVLRAERAEAPAAQAAEEALPLPLLQGHQVLPVHEPGLGGGGPTGLQAGIQHAQPSHPQVCNHKYLVILVFFSVRD